ncbi:pyridoxamine 5'-phosphate oxidase family protein [Kitasatospora sp. NPDC056138]|uniref:pyridoxamine 5'-phosphate oxidase family protein n=1 Tax=Kitasatospora sp. NPDC056138 TaxID=3345724 RepID=UPI0035D9527F
MNDNAQPAAAQRPDPGAIARRIADRCAQLGLTEDTLARNAAMAPGYLRHLIEVGPGFDPGGFVRVAAALHLTYRELLEGRTDAPPGQTGAAPRPVLVHLTEPECWEKLGTHGIGRIALPVRPGPAVFPVNYTVDAGTVVYRTDPQGGAAPGAGAEVSFQADHIDDHLSQGWSVLIVGTAQHVDDPETVQRLAQLPGTEPWAGGSRPLWIRIRPEQVTGRRIGTM